MTPDVVNPIKLAESEVPKGLEAAEKVNGYPLLPTFEKMSSGSDWNDLVSEIGKGAVQHSLEIGLNVMKTKQGQARSKLLAEQKLGNEEILKRIKELAQTGECSIAR